MTALLILSVILLFIIVLLLLPVTLEVSFSDYFIAKVYYAGILVYRSDKQNPVEQFSEDVESDTEKRTERYGILGTVKHYSRVISLLRHKISWFLKYVKIRKFELHTVVATDNAAKTAIEYGAVCSALYPVITLLDVKTNCKLSKINIAADFNKTAPEFSFYARLTSFLIPAFIAVYSTIREYQLIKDVTENERK